MGGAICGGLLAAVIFIVLWVAVMGGWAILVLAGCVTAGVLLTRR